MPGRFRPGTFMRLVAIDTETTGLDLFHGCLPFMLAGCDDQGQITSWRWRVDPKTRNVTSSNGDKLEIWEYLDQFDRIIFHNAKFDIRALEMLGVPLPKDIWDRVDDTILASHCLASLGPHDLKTLALKHCDILDDDEEALREACISARRFGEKMGWRIAKALDPHWPTTKTGLTWWAADMWMPGEIFQRVNTEEYEIPPEWEAVCETYCHRDVERTLALWYVFRDALHSQGLQSHYEVRRQLLRSTYLQEKRGLALRKFRCVPVQEKHTKLSAHHERECFRLVDNKIDNLDSPKQLTSALFEILGLPVIKRTPKTNNPSTDKDVLAELDLHCRPASRAGWFLRHLKGYRKRSHAAETVASYLMGCRPLGDNFGILHPNVNITGTAETRQSSNNPNGQNIAKGEGLPKEEMFNLRDLFGPPPGRLWYSHDYSNIEMRIFALLAGEQSLLDAFARGESAHLIIAEKLYPQLFDDCSRRGTNFKDDHPDLYQWVKNGNFSLIYGAGVDRADRTYHVQGAYKLIRREFKQIDRFMRTTQAEAAERGFVTTLGGYQLQVPDTAAHKAVNYKIQGSAGWAMNLAQNRVQQYLDETVDWHIIMQVHDELLTDCPQVHSLDIPYHIKALMERSGKDLGLDLPVEMHQIRVSWDQELPVPELKRSIPE